MLHCEYAYIKGATHKRIYTLKCSQGKYLCGFFKNTSHESIASCHFINGDGYIRDDDAKTLPINKKMILIAARHKFIKK